MRKVGSRKQIALGFTALTASLLASLSAEAQCGDSFVEDAKFKLKLRDLVIPSIPTPQHPIPTPPLPLPPAVSKPLEDIFVPPNPFSEPILRPPILNDIPLPGIVKKVEKVGDDTVTTIEKPGAGIIKTVQKADGEVTRTIDRANKGVIQTVEKADAYVVAVYHKAEGRVAVTVQKGWRDVSHAAKDAFHEVVDAYAAVGRSAVRQAKGDIHVLSETERRLREGKVVNALWELATGQAKSSEANAGRAFEESALLRAAAEVAAGAEGGPAGAAAFAAWYAYRETGDANIALRVGVLTALTSVAGAPGQMPTATVSDVAKKAIMSGAVAGLATAAAGGNKESIKTAFLRAGSKVLVQDGYHVVTGGTMDDRTYGQAALCMSDRNASCLPNPKDYVRDTAGHVLDAAGDRIDPDGTVRDALGQVVHDAQGLPKIGIPAVIVPPPTVETGHLLGLDVKIVTPPPGAFVAANDHSIEEEHAAAMTALSKVPGLNAVMISGGEWMLSWTWNAASNETAPYGYPAIVLTRAGAETPLYARAETISPEAAEGLLCAPPAPPPLSKQGYSTSYICTGPDDAVQAIDVVVDGPQACRVLRTTAGENATLFTGADEAADCAPRAATAAAQLRANGLACLAR